METKKVSIIICTRNRAESLRSTLESISHCVIAEGWTVELLVIDNASTDHTRQVVEAAKPSQIAVRYVFEPVVGQCHARNRGVGEAEGKVIIFTDDDVRVPVGWVTEMCQPILRGEADAVAGGVIFPQPHARLLAAPPLHHYRGWFAATDCINPDRPERMVGANMAFGSHVLNAVPGFDVSLGPGGLGFYDETLFTILLVEAGFRLLARFDVAVEHHFDLSRLTRSNILGLARRMGASRGYVAWHMRLENRKSMRAQRWKMFVGLTLRRLLRPWTFFQPYPPFWEVQRLLKIAYCDKIKEESRREPLYAKVSERAAVAI